MSFLQQLGWREATKNFDATKKIDAETLEKILTATQMTPSSFGLQPYKIYVVSDEEVRKKIQENAWNQAQVVDASHLLVFCSRTDILEKRIDELLEASSGGNVEIKEKMKGYEDLMRQFLGQRDAEKMRAWADRQTYIALGFAMAACAEIKVDSCAIEGFSPEKTDEILGLPENEKSVVLLPIGYRKEDNGRPKVRFSKKDLFTIS
jgi:nitroreductase